MTVSSSTNSTALPTSEPTTATISNSTHIPSANSTNTNGNSSHFIAAGGYSTTSWNGYASDDYFLCTDDSSDQSAIESPLFGFNITVSCCELNGTDGARPDCNAYPVTYDEALQICEDNGYRLCTLQELLWDEITRDRTTGCSFDASYNWVSDSCTMAPTTEPTMEPTMDPTMNRTIGGMD